MPLRRLSKPQVAFTPLGAYDRQIALYAPGGQDSAGNPIPPSPAFENLWASVTALGGQEIDRAQQIAQDATHLVKMPYFAGVTESMTVQYGTRVFQIHYVEDPDERQVELRLFCSELGQNAGGS